MTTLDLPPAALRAGDLVQTDDGWLPVVGEPLTMHRGRGVFDAFELLIGVRVARPGAPRPALASWPVDELVRVRR